MDHSQYVHGFRHRKYVTAVSQGTSPLLDEIVLSVYGPRGGCRAIESLSIESARRLRDELSAVLDEIEREKAS